MNQFSIVSIQLLDFILHVNETCMRVPSVFSIAFIFTDSFVEISTSFVYIKFRTLLTVDSLNT